MPLRRSSPTRRRRRLTWFLLPAGLLVCLGVLALGFRTAPADAQAARDDLQAAKTALDAGDTAQAEAAVEQARARVDSLQDSVQGVGGDVWSWVPVAGGPVRDVRRLGNALDDLVSVAEVGVDAWPQVDGPKATLLRDGDVDIPTLMRVADAVQMADEHVTTATAELADVPDSRLLVGTRLGDLRSQAVDEVEPVDDALEVVVPLMDALPKLLGADAERNYLLAILNPSEQRYSGGAPLTVATLTARDGGIEVGEARDTTEAELFQPARWRKVGGNPFHRGARRLSTANFAPTWDVSGKEMLRAWLAVTGEPMDGLVAVDVMAMRRLLEITGPVSAPGIGQLNADNFVQQTVGDYSSQLTDNEARKARNRALIPLFADKLFEAGDGAQKLESLHASAQARNFAIYLRDPDAQAALEKVGMAGTFPEASLDHLAVFSQNTNASKADYWQRRTLKSEVALQSDGSAKVRLTVTVHNDSPAVDFYVPDPGSGYTTRWSRMTLGVFLPEGSSLTAAEAPDQQIDLRTGNYYGRRFKQVRLELAPGATQEVVLEYDVPSAASVLEDGGLAYSLDLTPQGLVDPEAVDVTVTAPKGFHYAGVPEGWTGGGRRASYENPDLVTSPSFTLEAVAAD